MTLYTTEEIKADVEAFEGVKTEITRPMSATVLYSEVNSRTSHNRTVDDLQKKIDDYIATYCSLPLDEAPDNDVNLYTVYSGDFKKGPYKKIGSLRVGDDSRFSELVNQITDDQPNCIVLDFECKLVGCYSRVKH